MAEGTLTPSDWRANGASMSAHSLTVRISRHLATHLAPAYNMPSVIEVSSTSCNVSDISRSPSLFQTPTYNIASLSDRKLPQREQTTSDRFPL